MGLSVKKLKIIEPRFFSLRLFYYIYTVIKDKAYESNRQLR